MVINRHSRRGISEIGRLYAGLAKRGVRVAAFHPVANNVDAARCIKRAAKAGAPAILVGGGDGTMAHAVGVLAHRDTILGVLPLGTGNSFAQSLGLQPHDLDAALDVVAGGHVATVDLGVVNGTYFANFATIGLSSIIADATPHRWKALFGIAAYAAAAIRPLLRHRSFRASIRWDGGKLTLDTQDVIVANGRFFGATPVAPEASLTSGRLTLFTTENASTAGAVETYLALGLDAQMKLADAHVVNAAEFTLRARPKQLISIDGSPLERTPAHFRVATRALRVFVPAAGVAHAE